MLYLCPCWHFFTCILLLLVENYTMKIDIIKYHCLSHSIKLTPKISSQELFSFLDSNITLVKEFQYCTVCWKIIPKISVLILGSTRNKQTLVYLIKKTLGGSLCIFYIVTHKKLRIIAGLLRHGNAVYNQSPIDRWMRRWILLFPKKDDLGLTKNYRGITLTSKAALIYNALLRNPK